MNHGTKFAVLATQEWNILCKVTVENYKYGISKLHLNSLLLAFENPMLYEITSNIQEPIILYLITGIKLWK